MSSSERERQLHNYGKAAKDMLLGYYSKQFAQAINEFEAAISRGDGLTAANAFMTATATNSLLRDIENLSNQI